MPDLDLGNLGLGVDAQMHHEQPEKQAPVIVENLGAGQTGAEGEVTRVSAESDQEQATRQQDPPPPKQQVSRPTVPPQQPSTQVSIEAAMKQAAKEQQK